MKRKLLPLLLASMPAAYALESLDDSVLSAVTAQDGLTIQNETANITLDNLRYTDDGNTLNFQGINIVGSQGQTSLKSTTDIDIENNALVLHQVVSPRLLSINNLTINPTGTNDPSFGRFDVDYSMDNWWRIKGGGGIGSTGINLDGTHLNLNAKRITWFANANQLNINDLVHQAQLNNFTIDVDNNAIVLGMGNSTFTTSIGSIGFVGSDGTNWGSFGKFDSTLNLGGTLKIAGGGAQGSSGLRFYPNLTFTNSQFKYTDVDTVNANNTGVIWAKNLSGNILSNSGISMDVSNNAIEFSMPDFEANYSLGELVLGKDSNQKLGSFDLNLKLVDEGTHKNYLKLSPGGMTPYTTWGYKGITAEFGWNMKDSWLGMTDNGNQVWFSGLRGYGDGKVYVNLTCGSGAACPANATPTYPGIRFTVDKLQGSYSFDGLRVGSKSGALQGGTELLLSAGFFPAYDFKFESGSQFTIRPGGSAGSGLTWNSDMKVISDASFTSNAAVTVDENGKGLWLAGINYDMHNRNGTIDVTAAGMEISKGEYWSTLDASDIRFGTKTTGTSLGRLVIKRYEQGSTLKISSGGAGIVCIGGEKTSATTCANGATLEDRGNEGLTISLKNMLAAPAQGSTLTSDKRNQVMWETNRRSGNGTGTQFIIDNITTNDGTGVSGNTNNYGFNVDLNVDVAPTKVVYKENCIPTCLPNGANVGDAYQVNGSDPLGFAVNGRIHFKEINIESIYHKHPDVASAERAMYGLKLQNGSINANLTATPFSR